MNNPSTSQIIVTALLGSGLVSGLLTLFAKKIWSPEASNDLARLGNEFARQLLEDAKVERNELRLTIEELRGVNLKNEETLRRLNRLADEKDAKIRSLELKHLDLAKKIHEGKVITLMDIFGDQIPHEFLNDINPEVI